MTLFQLQNEWNELFVQKLTYEIDIPVWVSVNKAVPAALATIVSRHFSDVLLPCGTRIQKLRVKDELQ